MFSPFRSRSSWLCLGLLAATALTLTVAMRLLLGVGSSANAAMVFNTADANDLDWLGPPMSNGERMIPQRSPGC